VRSSINGNSEVNNKVSKFICGTTGGFWAMGTYIINTAQKNKCWLSIGEAF
jgi:vesicle coat complex subunit